MTNLKKVQEAIFAKLDENLDFEVGDSIPEGLNLPFAFLADIEYSPMNTKTSYGREINQTIYTFSNFNGKEETFKMTERIEEILNGEFEVEGSTVIDNQVIRVRVEEADNGLIQGTIVFHIKLGEVYDAYQYNARE